ncbi:MAG: toll/interleukin-1 receptor domain-containing protein, partial [Oscillibacter sp.]|nr:toll/interleukin-1 receptor domain-containing protein [Oscillibacter sp.]
MENARFQPYEGQEPYIFASYSHRDSGTVLPILDAMNKRGFRVWYDQGIPGAAEWETEIANHVATCAVCLAFHSKHSQTSEHCDAELMYARKKNRPILSVYLEDGVELNPGVEMYLTRYQSVKWRDFPDVGAYLDRMEREAAVRPCKIQPVWHYDGQIQWSLTGDGVLTIAAKNPDYPVKMPNNKRDNRNKTSTAP